MKKLMCAIKTKFDKVCCSIAADAQTSAVVLAQDVEGSDTTEKIGMVVVAVVVIGLLATAMKTFMPDIFSSIGSTAKSTLMGIF